MGDPKRRSKPKPVPVVGWREWVRLPELCLMPIKAKVDTGARTSTLHAFDLALSDDKSGVTIARFSIHPMQRSAAFEQVVTAPVKEMREIRSSSGHREWRPVIDSQVAIGEHRFVVEITLTSRDEMGFRMLLGRAALRRRFLVDPGRSYQQGNRK